MIPLTDEENESYEKQKVCYIYKTEFNSDEFNTDENDKNEFNTDENNKNEFKPYHKVRDHCHYTGKFRGATHNICNLRYKTPDYHMIITWLYIWLSLYN